MSLFRLQARAVQRFPVVVLVVVVLITIGLGAGMSLRASEEDQEGSFLPEGSRLQQTLDKLDEDFASSSGIVPVQVIVRGNVLTPTAVQEVVDAMDAAAADELVAPALAPDSTVSSYAHSIAQLAGDRPPGDLSQEELDELLVDAATSGDPSRSQLAASVEVQVARDDGGTPIAGLGAINLIFDEEAGLDLDTLTDAQLAIEDVLTESSYTDVQVRSSSSAKINEEVNDAQSSGTTLLMGLALLVILVVLVLFYRTALDVVFSMIGLILTIVWTFGMQGILGPDGLDLIGPAGITTTMVPVLLIGLTVDYALQFSGRYREELSKGADSSGAVYEAVRQTGLPILLAAATTAISFFTSITNNLEPLRDLGIVAGLGVLFGMIVMTTFIPAMRTLLDRRTERRGKPLQMRLMADAIPGAGAVIGRLAHLVVRQPVPVLMVVIAVTIVAGIGARNVDSTFRTTDFLPSDTESVEDLNFLEDEFGGGVTSVTVLIEGDLLNDRLLRDILDFEAAVRDENTRPETVTGPPTASLATLIIDVSTDSGLPGDLYSPEFDEFQESVELGFFVPPEQIQEVYDELLAAVPGQTSAVLALNGNGEDRTIFRLPASSGTQEQTKLLIEDLEGIWPGDDEQLFFSSTQILQVTVSDDLIDSQTTSIMLTIIAALIVLAVFFGITKWQPLLGGIAVLPIALVVAWVLGTMYALDISYNIMTALITALTIGVGVDYTIHITHRFLEAREKHDIGDSVYEAMSTTGGALLGSALTTAGGFAVLVFAPLAPIQQFGFLTAITIVYSLIAAFLVLPPLLVLWALYDQWRENEIARRHEAGASPDA